ncbi:hypothetical protein F5Y14DRAFT_413433 [Nemania sp. NC0429]|nr:hypothetical protein F5Y14DRAFT_413433 [Nemania sp. NC0429]
MQSNIFLAALSAAILGSFPGAVLGVPSTASAPQPQPSPLPTPIPIGPDDSIGYYDGPCWHTDCGYAHRNCRNKKLWCIPFPNAEEATDCRCGHIEY